LTSLDSLIAALDRLTRLAEVEAANLFEIEREAFSVSARPGYRKTALFLVALIFDKLARKAESDPSPASGEAYAAICEASTKAISTNDWADGTPALEALVELSWSAKLLH
jgi:hypothetical protein